MMTYSVFCWFYYAANIWVFDTQKSVYMYTRRHMRKMWVSSNYSHSLPSDLNSPQTILLKGVKSWENIFHPQTPPKCLSIGNYLLNENVHNCSPRKNVLNDSLHTIIAANYLISFWPFFDHENVKLKIKIIIFSLQKLIYYEKNIWVSIIWGNLNINEHYMCRK